MFGVAGSVAETGDVEAMIGKAVVCSLDGPVTALLLCAADELLAEAPLWCTSYLCFYSQRFSKTGAESDIPRLTPKAR